MRVTLKLQELLKQTDDARSVDRCPTKISELSLKSPEFIKISKDHISRANRQGHIKSESSHMTSSIRSSLKNRKLVKHPD